jgi:type IV pilus assembly protein PilV
MKSIHSQSGSMMIEALVALVLFSFGILGLIGLQGSAINTNVDTRYRVEANNFANRLFSEIQGNLNRSSQAAYTASLAAFDHLSTGEQCTFTGTASTSPAVTAWLSDLQTDASRLPNAQAQIRVINGTTNQIRIVICWQQPGLPTPRRHVLMGAVT